MYKIRVTAEAHEDIEQTIKYIAEKLQNSSAATSFANDVMESYVNLSENPFMYALCSDPYLAGKGYRKIVIKNYIILYRIDREQNIVYIIRVIYGGRNYTEIV